MISVQGADKVWVWIQKQVAMVEERGEGIYTIVAKTMRSEGNIWDVYGSLIESHSKLFIKEL